MVSLLAFHPGRPSPQMGLLGRYLPPLADGVAAAWLGEHLPRGAWVLDPFGAAPGLAAEAARQGYRVLVAANNPVARFLLELAADPPGEAALRAALAELASARSGEERLEPYIQKLYETTCAQCGGTVLAEAFLWEREASAPYARLYHCPRCGDAGEHPTTPADVEKAARFAAVGLHRARALERIAPPDDPDRAHAEEALGVYLPRSIYVLTTLINKLEGLPPVSGETGVTGSARWRCLMALTLHALDNANALWPYPSGRLRPRQLSHPPRFRENNIWLALEEGVEALASPDQPIAITTWPDPPPEQGGIAIFEGRLKNLHALLSSDEKPPVAFEAALAALPRPNQAFWTLSALWAGWLWGHAALGPFKSVLRRRRYDWAWHSAALHAAFSVLREILPAQAPVFGLIGEAEPHFLTATIVAAEMANFNLGGMALRAENGQAQLWLGRSRDTKRVEDRGKPVSPVQEGIVARAGMEYLRQRGEPAMYMHLHAAALAALAEKATLPGSEHLSPAEAHGQVQEAIEKGFTSQRGLMRYGGSEKSLEAGVWWLQERLHTDVPLADRAEIAAVRYLQARPGCTPTELDAAVCAALPGLMTPAPELVALCLESYGEEEAPGSGRWELRDQDSPAVRRSDLSAIRKSVAEIGVRLGYIPQGEKPLLYLEQDGRTALDFFVIASALIGEILLTSPYPAAQSLIVLPGARANLALYKLRHDPRLRQAVDQGWRFVKFRLVRHLAEAPGLSRDNLDEQLALDALTETTSQMRLL